MNSQEVSDEEMTGRTDRKRKHAVLREESDEERESVEDKSRKKAKVVDTSNLDKQLSNLRTNV